MDAPPPFPSNPNPGIYLDLSKAQSYREAIAMLAKNRETFKREVAKVSTWRRAAYTDECSLALGLPVHLSKLNALDYPIIHMPIEQQATLADAPARHVASDHDESLRQLASFERQPGWSGAGACANTAYVALYSTSEEMRKLYKRALDSMIKAHPRRASTPSFFAGLWVLVMMVIALYRLCVAVRR